MSRERVVVVGGRGFVGSHVARRLLALGYDVHVLGPRMTVDLLARERRSLTFHDCSITDFDELHARLLKVAPSALVSCAAYGGTGRGLLASGAAHPHRAFAINADGMRVLLAAAASVPRIVWTSSTVVYGPASAYDGAVDEDDQRHPATIYGITKVLAEDLAAAQFHRGRAITGLRLPLVLGPDLWYRGAAATLMQIFEQAKIGQPAKIAYHDEPVDLMHVEDVARAMCCALAHERLRRPHYNIAGFTARASEIVGAIKRYRRDFRAELVPEVPAALFPLVCDAAFRAETGFAPRIDLATLCRSMLA